MHIIFRNGMTKCVLYFLEVNSFSLLHKDITHIITLPYKTFNIIMTTFISVVVVFPIAIFLIIFEKLLTLNT